MLSRGWAVVLWAALAILPADANELTDFCSGNNGQTISQCPRMCSPACSDGAFLSHSATIRDTCRSIMATAEDRRVDAPQCAEMASTTPDPCAAYALPSDDDAIPSEGAPPPPCLRSFEHLRCRLEYLADNIKALSTKFTPMVERYRPLRQQLRMGQDPNEVERFLCGISRQDMTTDYRTSQVLDDDVKKLTRDFDEQNACIVATKAWIGSYKFTSGIDQGVMEQAIIKGLNRRLTGPMEAQQIVQGLMADVDNSRSVIVDIYQLHRAVCGPEQH